MKATIETYTNEILKAAQDSNYWGKRLLSSRRDVAGEIADRYTSGQGVSEIMDFLDSNKPVKVAAQKEPAEPMEPVFTHTSHHYDNAEKWPTHDSPVVVYAVQNNASIAPLVMATINKVVEELDALVLPCRVGYIVDKETDDLNHVPSETQKAPIWIGDHLVLAGDVIPTAKKPVSHAKLASNGRALTILPHTRQQAESLPRAKGSPESWAITTGCVTLPRYKQGRAGSEAHADHCLGFTIVEPDGSFRQVELNEEGIGYHAGLRFSPQGITDQIGGTVVLGDVHSEKMDHAFLNKTCNWLDTIQPDRIIIHDLFDMTSRNHHNRQNGLFLASQKDRTVEDDLCDALDVLDRIQEACPHTTTIYIVNSNHDRALDTWLDDPSVDPRKDAANLPLWCDLQKLRFHLAMSGEALPVTLESALLQISDDDIEPTIDFSRIHFLAEDESLMIDGIEYGQHGDRGINGARGGYTAFEKLGSCYVIGHSHSGYKNGKRVAVSGVTGSMDMGYNKGASSWSHSHIFVGLDAVPQIIMGSVF